MFFSPFLGVILSGKVVARGPFAFAMSLVLCKITPPCAVRNARGGEGGMSSGLDVWRYPVATTGNERDSIGLTPLRGACPVHKALAL